MFSWPELTAKFLEKVGVASPRGFKGLTSLTFGANGGSAEIDNRSFALDGWALYGHSPRHFARITRCTFFITLHS